MWLHDNAKIAYVWRLWAVLRQSCEVMITIITIIMMMMLLKCCFAMYSVQITSMQHTHNVNNKFSN